tara:strand:- start:48 stop:605 length:558 start_codon:yes stop_codon:yes gene_type:complete
MSLEEAKLKENLHETLFNTFAPIKVLISSNELPKSLWEDDFLFGFFITFISDHIRIGYSTIGKFSDFNEIQVELMQKIDPINYGFILSKSQYFTLNRSSEMIRGGDISEKLLYLYFNKNKQLFPNVKDDDELILNAEKKVNNTRNLFNKAEVKHGDFDSLNDNIIASFALFDLEIISYVRQKYKV